MLSAMTAENFMVIWIYGFDVLDVKERLKQCVQVCLDCWKGNAFPEAFYTLIVPPSVFNLADVAAITFFARRVRTRAIDIKRLLMTYLVYCVK